MTGSAASFMKRSWTFMSLLEHTASHPQVASAEIRLARFHNFDFGGRFIGIFGRRLTSLCIRELPPVLLLKVTDRALAAARRVSVSINLRALLHEHHFRGFSMLPSTSSHLHTSGFRSSLQPQRIPATSAGLVEVKLCVDSFMIIHMCSSL